MIDGYTTSVDPSKTAMEITRLLTKHKVHSIQTNYGPTGTLVGMSFEIPTKYGPKAFKLPIRAEGVLRTLKRDRAEPRYLTIEHATKVAWRIALKWLQAQLALIDADMTTLDEVFFPYLIGTTDHGRPITMYEAYASTQKEIEG